MPVIRVRFSLLIPRYAQNHFIFFAASLAVSSFRFSYQWIPPSRPPYNDRSCGMVSQERAFVRIHFFVTVLAGYLYEACFPCISNITPLYNMSHLDDLLSSGCAGTNATSRMNISFRSGCTSYHSVLEEVSSLIRSPTSHRSRMLIKQEP